MKWFVWTIKYRYKVLIGGIAELARELIRQSCNNNKWFNWERTYLFACKLFTKYFSIKTCIATKGKDIKNFANGI